MKNMKRRLLSMLIALAMMLTCMPALAFAADEENADALQSEEPVQAEEQAAGSEEEAVPEEQVVTLEEQVPAEEPQIVISDQTLTSAYFSDAKYTGKAVRPNVAIAVNGVTLAEGTDYTISCSKNKKIGKATVTVTGCGRYTGSITRTFKIIPKGCSLKSLKSKKGSGKCTVTWKKGPKYCNGYKIRYSTDPNFANSKSKTIKGRNRTSITLTKLTKGATYYVQVRTYKTVNKTKYNSKWSKVRSIAIKDKAEAKFVYISESPIKAGKYYDMQS